MEENTGNRENVPSEILVGKIREKRSQLDAFIREKEPHQRFLLNTVLVSSTLSTALTISPALGGKSFTDWLTSSFNLNSPSWRILCGVAALFSIIAALSTQLLQSHRIEEKVSRARDCRSRLEGLEASLSLKQISIPQAASEYLKCVEQAGSIDSKLHS